MDRREFLGVMAATPLAAAVPPESEKPPFSFVYGGRPSLELLPTWKSETKSFELDAARTREEFSYTDPATGLAVRAVATVFKDFPAREWVLYFKNTGGADSAILENVCALDAPFTSPKGDPIVHYARGAVCSMDDFMPLRRVLNSKGRLHIQPGGGRSSSDFLPFFNVEMRGGDGVMIGIGWSGEWAATFTHDSGPDFRVQAGMALTHLKLHPGEEIRSPLVLTMSYPGGDRLRGQNLLRRFILKYHRPSAGGRPVNMPLCNGNWGGTRAADHLENIRLMVAHKISFDYYWIDAEWFGKGPWYVNPGDWRVKQELYPEGFKPISDALHRAGLKLLLWFEPERVCEGTPWDREHREWLLEVPKPKRVYNWGASQADPAWVSNESYRNQIRENDRLFNLANPDARRFLTGFISAKIDEFGLDCYRHDANIAPLEFWRAADAPDRQGITEIRWVEGLYSFWDELLRRHPNLIIDNCASGGRRIDLESLSRTLPLWRTDYPSNLTGKQCHTFGLLHWVPLNATSAGNLARNNDYPLRSSMSSGLDFGLFGRGDAPQSAADLSTFPFEEVRRTLDQYRSLQRYFYGDYYPLTQYSQAEDAWMAYQLDLPERGEGLVVVMKRPSSPFTNAAFPLKALQRDARYELVNLDDRQTSAASGAQLLDGGVELALREKPAAALIRYRRI